MSNGFVLAGLIGRAEVGVPVVKFLLNGIDDVRTGCNRPPGALPLPSPNRTKASIAFSKFPPTPFKTIAFLLSSVKPISRSLVNFCSVSSTLSGSAEKLTPNTADPLFRSGG